MDVAKITRAKFNRLKSDKPLRVLDLFSGCGGLSLGFQRAGFDIVAAVENDPLAAQSHARNFSRHHRNPEVHANARDITEQEPSDLLSELRIRGNIENAIDIIVGGPPCQAFARVGRAKLREVDEHPKAFLRDPRSNLYLRYLQYVRELCPLALVMENVPDVMNFGGHNVANEVCEVLDDIGYHCQYTLLNSAFYGVPQMRERMFLLAYRKELNASIQFPAPTNWVDLPIGYSGTRNVAMQVLVKNGYRHDLPLFKGEEAAHFFVSPPPAHEGLPPAITTEEATRDLPPITLHLEGQLKRGARRFTELAEYRHDIEPTEYGRLMRTWPGFQNRAGVYDHVIRSLPRDYPIFAAMEPGDQYPQAHKLACKLCEKERVKRRIKKGTAKHEELIAEMVPPYDPGKFPNKWRKLESFLPSRTLLAHIGKDTYSHIHYNSDQARTISVREAARLQSFPDGFVFEGTMNPAFRQIGNAVPPLMANAIAKQMLKTLVATMRRGKRLVLTCPQ